MSFKEIAPEELQENAFKVIGKDWLLVTGTAEGKSNAMTASWGGMGVMWGKPVAFLVIRPQRYTKEFIDKAGLTAVEDNGRVYFEEARMAMVCRKLYAQEMQEGCLLDAGSKAKWYPDKDYHTLYIVEIEKMLVKE